MLFVGGVAFNRVTMKVNPLGAWRAARERICINPTNVPQWLGTGSRWAWREAAPVATPRQYGTRSSTVVLVDASGRMKVVERHLGDGKEAAIHNAERNTFEFCDV